jgi:hypothetical protein
MKLGLEEKQKYTNFKLNCYTPAELEIEVKCCFGGFLT